MAVTNEPMELDMSSFFVEINHKHMDTLCMKCL